jgi:hypothetical protein
MVESFWLQFVTTGLGSGFALALTKIIFDWRQRKRNQRHLVLRLAIYFEGYAVNCASMAVDHRTAVENKGHAGRFLGKVPEPGPLPDSDAYDLLDTEDLDTVLDFAQRRHMAQEDASFWWDTVGDSDCYQTAVEENTIKMGILTLEIARKLRTKYKIKSRNMKFGKWDIDQHLAEERKRLTELEKKRDAWEAEEKAKRAG